MMKHILAAADSCSLFSTRQVLMLARHHCYQ